MYTIHKEVYLNKYEKKYETILVTDSYPDVLSPYIRKIKLPKVSVYKQHTANECKYCFHDVDNPSKSTLLLLNDLPTVINILKKKSLMVNYEISDILDKHMDKSFILAYSEN